jgi:hypothetical protein
MIPRKRLIRAVTRSLREHPEDWRTNNDNLLFNDHIKVFLYDDGLARNLDIRYKKYDQIVVEDWRTWRANFVPWRRRMIKAIAYAKAQREAAIVAGRVEDTFAEPMPRTSAEATYEHMMLALARLGLRQQR